MKEQQQQKHTKAVLNIINKSSLQISLFGAEARCKVKVIITAKVHLMISELIFWVR